MFMQFSKPNPPKHQTAKTRSRDWLFLPYTCTMSQECHLQVMVFFFLLKFLVNYRCCPSIEDCMHGSWISCHHPPSKLPHPPVAQDSKRSRSKHSSSRSKKRRRSSSSRSRSRRHRSAGMHPEGSIYRYESYSLVVRPCLHAQHVFSFSKPFFPSQPPFPFTDTTYILYVLA